MEHFPFPRKLCTYDAGGLKKLGLARDERGQIRTADGGRVCAISGRVHRKKLFRMPNYFPDEDGVRVIWVSSRVLNDAAVRGAPRVLSHLMEAAFKYGSDFIRERI